MQPQTRDPAHVEREIVFEEREGHGEGNVHSETILLGKGGREVMEKEMWTQDLEWGGGNQFPMPLSLEKKIPCTTATSNSKRNYKKTGISSEKILSKLLTMVDPDSVGFSAAAIDDKEAV